jgi:glycosyltransferase involved in cell wall biosynthesis
MSGRTLWYIVSPTLRPAPGGASVYYDTLGRALASAGQDVVIATEAFPGQPRQERQALGEGSLAVDRLFPLRAGRAAIDWKSYLAYGWQNALFLTLPGRLKAALRATGADRAVVLIHSSFFYKSSVLPTMLDRLRRQLPGATRLVVDVRDPLFDDDLAPLLARFDVAIGCSRMISDRLRGLLPDGVEVANIPIPFAPADVPDEAEVAKARAEHGLAGIPYVLNPNGVAEPKRYPEMLDVVRALRTMPGYEAAVLATIGRARDWKPRDDAAVAEGVLRYVGVVPNRTAIALAKGAIATLILSRVEGMPRSALETLALGQPLIGPSIPEFDEHIPASVVQSDDPSAIARQIVSVCETPTDERYPLESHRMEALLPAYLALVPGECAVQETD